MNVMANEFLSSGDDTMLIVSVSESGGVDEEVAVQHRFVWQVLV